MRGSAALGLLVTALFAASVVIVLGAFVPAAEVPCPTVAITVQDSPTVAGPTAAAQPTPSTPTGGGGVGQPVVSPPASSTVASVSSQIPSGQSTVKRELRCVTIGESATAGAR